MFKLFCFIYLVSVLNTYTTSLRRTLDGKQEQDRMSNNYNFRVHKGRDLRKGEYPYVIVIVEVYTDNKECYRFCTGSMISETWGITAAHCLESKPNVIIQYDNFTEPALHSGCYVPVIEMIWHPSYHYLNTDKDELDFVNNDIAMFRCKSVPRKPHAVLLSADYATLIGLPVVYVGSGMTKWTYDENDETRPLQLGEATIITCDEEMRRMSKFAICLASKCSNRMENSWYGDSGGPLIYDGKIIGVCSYGIESKILARGGYTPVSPYLEWIHHVMNMGA